MAFTESISKLSLQCPDPIAAREHVHTLQNNRHREKNQPICLTCLVSSCIIQTGRISFPVPSFMEIFFAINILNGANACICQRIMMRRMNHCRMFCSCSLSTSHSVFFFFSTRHLSFSPSLFSCFSSHFVIACHDQRQGKWPGSIVTSV